jgi:hypothetical protein
MIRQDSGHKISGHKIWLYQIEKLRKSMQTLTCTNPGNIIEHFFTQAMENEFCSESTAFKTILKQILTCAIHYTQTGSCSESAAIILQQVTGQTKNDAERRQNNFRLADIRNYAVFNMYRRKGITIDTYFERFSSPPGSKCQNEAYARVAHGSAVCNADQTSKLADTLTYLQFIKRVLIVKQLLSDQTLTVSAGQLNWIGSMMVAKVEDTNLSTLIWELFVDIFNYENLSF